MKIQKQTEQVLIGFDCKPIPILNNLGQSTQNINFCKAVYSPAENSKLSRAQRFIEQHAPFAILTQRMTGIPASVTLAQAGLESNWGRSAPGNNYFGIKGVGPEGSQRLWTREFQNGHFIRTKANFRAYADPLQSFLDHAHLLGTSKHFRGAMAHTQTPQAFIHALQSGKARYATDPHYETKLMNLIHTHQLEKYDVIGKLSNIF